MAYSSIPRVGAGYIDGAFRGSVTSTQSRILIVGTASQGLSYELFAISDVAQAEKTFGKTSEMLRSAHEAFSLGADNIALMRIGGKAGKVVLTSSSGKVLTITTGYHDNQILDRYALIIQASSIDATMARVLIFDLVDLNYVYDSDELEVLDTGVISVEGVENWPVACITNGSDSNPFKTTDISVGTIPPNALRLGTIAAADLVGVGFAQIRSKALGLVTSSDFVNVASVTKEAGTDGTGMSSVERYACLEYAYQLLDFRDVDVIIPCGVYHDMPNIAVEHEDAGTRAVGAVEVTGGPVGGSTITIVATDGTSQVYTAAGTESTAAGEFLNSGSNDVIATSIKACIEVKQAGKILVSAVASGKITLTQVTGGTAGNTTIASTGTTNCTLTNFVGGSAVANWGNLTASTGSDSTGITAGCSVKVVPTYLGSSDERLHLSGMRADSEDDFLGYVWQYRYKGKIYTFFADATNVASASTNVVGHNDLTGEEVPTAVYTRFNSAVAAEFRECNFSHQLASFCYRASTNWSQILGIISTEVPSDFIATTLRKHAGVLPVYTIKGDSRVIDSAADNGVGLLGDKFLGGQFQYRNGAIDAADKDVTDGYGRGGLILTVGASLPNKEPYGIKDTDEAVDSNSRPVDIGKHIIVCYDWPLITSGFNGGSLYCNSIVASIAAKLAVLPENIEPIGSNGNLLNVKKVRKHLISQINDLAFIRMCGLRDDSIDGATIVSCKTAAHPTSDYSRLSTIRCVNKVLSGIRSLARGYIGTPFSSTGLLSLQQSIDRYLSEQRAGGYHQGAVASMSYSRADRIIGKLTIQLKMIPPFSIETIIVETSLAAEETEL